MGKHNNKKTIQDWIGNNSIKINENAAKVLVKKKEKAEITGSFIFSAYVNQLIENDEV